jgi:hypothetical protein
MRKVITSGKIVDSKGRGITGSPGYFEIYVPSAGGTRCPSQRMCSDRRNSGVEKLVSKR